jgi:hypothetical protein
LKQQVSDSSILHLETSSWLDDRGAVSDLLWHLQLGAEAASCKLQAASCKLQAASCKLQAASFKLQAASCKAQ